MITIIDYGAGNINSIQNMFKKIGVESRISKEPEIISKSSKLILPGVGNFDFGMKNLHASGLVEVLRESVMENKTPILGICLGAQMLGNWSEEGGCKGLGWIDMDVVKFNESKMKGNFRIPNMGWNSVQIKKSSKLLPLPNNGDICRYYFVHKYHMKTKSDSDVLATVNYGYTFAAAVEKDNVFGVQFHPEKSHQYGMKILENYSKI
ncbi:imidazole glycerol phosphate synthase subunit HisH [Vicingaceae bacterium]|nr:imidazole glycerol phosphate synthase subunit HisH [Vicingaceae bacterium]